MCSVTAFEILTNPKTTGDTHFYKPVSHNWQLQPQPPPPQSDLRGPAHPPRTPPKGVGGEAARESGRQRVKNVFSAETDFSFCSEIFIHNDRIRSYAQILLQVVGMQACLLFSYTSANLWAEMNYFFPNGE